MNSGVAQAGAAALQSTKKLHMVARNIMRRHLPLPWIEL
jgi:hypothetical protein